MRGSVSRTERPQQGEDNHQYGIGKKDAHDNGRVVRVHRSNKQGSDAGNAKDLLGNKGTGKNAPGPAWPGRSRQESEHSAPTVPHNDATFTQSLGSCGTNIVQMENFKDGGSHETGNFGRLEERENRNRHRCLTKHDQNPIQSPFSWIFVV